jgi:PASTA domain
MRQFWTRASRPRSFLLIAIAAGSLITLVASSPIYSASTSDPIVGDWNVTYGNPAVVTMSLAGAVYTETAKTPVELAGGSSCDLPPGTIIATFSSVGGNSYSGQHGLWYTSNCAFASWASLTLTLSSDGRTLTGRIGNYAPTFTKILTQQSIAFASLADKTYGDPGFTVSATATSGLTVSFAASGSCTVSGATVHLTGAGSCTITASQAGDSTYSAATNVSQTFSIATRTQPPTKCTVPNVVGMLLGKAVLRIAHAHCRPGRVIRTPSSKALKNRVLAQNPKPGKNLKNDAKVNLTVGKGSAAGSKGTPKTAPTTTSQAVQTLAVGFESYLAQMARDRAKLKSVLTSVATCSTSPSVLRR